MNRGRLLLHLRLLLLGPILVVATLAHIVIKLICLRSVHKVISSTGRLCSCIQNVGLIGDVWTTCGSLRCRHYLIRRRRLLSAVMELLLDVLTLLASLVLGGKADRYLFTLYRHGEHFILIILDMNHAGIPLINLLFNSSFLSFLLNSLLDHIKTAFCFLIALRFLRLIFVGILIWCRDVTCRSKVLVVLYKLLFGFSHDVGAPNGLPPP